MILPALEAGISVASVEYRSIKDSTADGLVPPVKGPMLDCARALQFCRSKAKEWNLDKTKVALSGGSAGACTSLWLAFHDEMADPLTPRLRSTSRDNSAHTPQKQFPSRLFGFIFIAWIWMSPFLLGEGRYFGARWIAPGNFYQGFGITQDFHRIGLWVGRPYAGWGNPMRATCITSLSFPFDPLRHTWSANVRGPIWFQWGTPSGDSFRVKVDYWFLMPFYFMVWVAAMFSWQSRKRRLLARPTIETNAQQAGASKGG